MKMINKQLDRLNRREEKLIGKKKGLLQRNMDPLMMKIQNIVPEKVEKALNVMFQKAFYSVFEKGTSLIEKTYNKEGIEAKHIADDFVYENTQTRRALKNVGKSSKKIRKWGKRIAFIEGAGLGILGIGLPDIPIFTAVLLKGIYEISLHYGFDYRLYEEKIYILKLIQTALSEGEEKRRLNRELNRFGHDIEAKIWHGSLEGEIQSASQLLSEEMLVAKFIQGLPVVGVTGALFNHSIYKKISDLAVLKYKKRYLEKKQIKKTSIEVL